MTDADALLRTILEHPDEDTPRLVMADLLDEIEDPLCTGCGGAGRLDADHRPGAIECRMCWGQGRQADVHKDHAAFIRYQIESGIGHTADVTNWGRWNGKDELPKTLHSFAPGITFKRGFVSEITCSYAEFAANLNLWNRHPITRVVFPEFGDNHVVRRGRDEPMPYIHHGYVPKPLFDHIYREPFPPPSGYAFQYEELGTDLVDALRFPTTEDAQLALSRAAVTLARRHCGLPDLWGANTTLINNQEIQ